MLRNQTVTLNLSSWASQIKILLKPHKDLFVYLKVVVKHFQIISKYYNLGIHPVRIQLLVKVKLFGQFSQYKVTLSQMEWLEGLRRYK